MNPALNPTIVEMIVTPTATMPLVDQMKDGLRYVRDSTNLKTITLIGFIAAFLGLPLLTFLPVVARDVFQQDVGLYTRMMTTSGVGAVCGAMVVAWLGRHEHMGRLLLGLLGAFGLAMTAFALSPDVRLSTAILFFTGALLVMCFSLATCTSPPSPASRSTSSDTSAKSRGGRVAVPAKMTSSMPPPRSDLGLPSPITQRMASRRFDLPQPLGPTTPVSPGSMRSSAGSTKLLKPPSLSLRIFNAPPPPCAGPA